MKTVAKESQNQVQFDNYHSKGGVVLGPYTTHMWREDPRKLCFLLARYKFCAKMLEGKKNVLEVGCGDSIGTPIVLQSVGKVHGIDFEPLVIEDAIKRNTFGRRCTFGVHDMIKGPVSGSFDAAFSLDVIEHIPPSLEDPFLKNIADSLTQDGVAVLGTPNISSQQYASEGSRLGHINLKSGETFRDSLRKYFTNVFLFSMSDEVVHTGFSPMAHYLICIGVGKK
jgi:cyclopropane fatty-acyl-phospholipid synthase-like methyltransferase